MTNAYELVAQRYEEIGHLSHLMSIAQWDEAVMMPTGGGAARAAALSTLSGLQHQLKNSPDLKDQIEAAQSLDLTAWQQKNTQLIEKERVNASLLPSDLVRAMTEAAMICQQQWRVCRDKNDWKGLLPSLEKSFNLVKEAAEIRAEYWQCSAYDVMIDDYMPGFTQKSIDPLFEDLAQALPEAIEKVVAQQQGQVVQPLEGPFAIAQQQRLSEAIMRQLGFDFQHGRLYTTHHPFCGRVPDDVRVTTRYDEEDLFFSLMAVCHETGHALYEQGLPKNWRLQPVGHALGMALHESQSLFVEMQLCRSLAFYQWCCPLLEKQLGAQPGLQAENIYRLNTQVKPSLIRITADEVTYPLHVILRYQLEKKLFSGEISLRDLPDCWNDLMQQYLGISTLGDDANGVMQDVHWPSGAFGYFPAYTLGRLIAAQLFEAMSAELSDVMSQIQQGDFKAIMQWLREKIHQQGQLLSVDELILQATGSSLGVKAFLNHVDHRYLGSV